MTWPDSTWGAQWGEDYGAVCGGACIGLIIAGVGAVASAGVQTAVALKNAADRRQKVRITQLKSERQKIQKRRKALKARRAKVEEMIASSQKQIAEAKAKAESRTPWVLYSGVAGMIFVTLLAARAAKRG